VKVKKARSDRQLGAVKIGDDKVSDPAQKVAQPAGKLVIQAGKGTFVKVK
jgi:tyrosyl-tRNA synthetase